MFIKRMSEDLPDLDLMAVGTRYDHYVELREAFAVGVEILKNILPQYLTPEMLKKQKILEGAIQMVDGRLNALSNYHKEMSDCGKFRRSINAIPQVPVQRQLTEGSDANQVRTDDKRKGPETHS